MTKTKKGIIIAIVAVIIAAAVGCGLYFGLGGSRAEPADVQVQEGEIYRTKTESFWAGVGKAYISFQHKEEPENKAADDTELYGDVFYIMVSSGEGFDPWLIGNYNLDEANGKLMMKASWDVTAENQTKLADANSGEEKIYIAENGEYKIPVELPSAKVTFTLNPATDKVGELTPAPDDSISDVAEQTDGEQEEKNEESTGNLFARLKAEDSLFDGGVKGYAQIDMLKDKTWTMKIKVEPYVPSYTSAVSGTWTENSDSSLTLTVTGGDYKDSLASPITFKKGSNGVYTGAVKFTADKANGIVFNFNFKSVEVKKDEVVSPNSSSTSSQSGNSNSSSNSTPSTPVAVQKGELYRTPVYHGIYSGIVGDAYISFYGTGEFKIFVDAGQGYDNWFTGKWSMNEAKTELSLLQEAAGDAGITGATVGTPKIYRANNGVFSISAYFPSGGTAEFSFNPTRDKVGENTPSKPETPVTPEEPDTPDVPDKPDEPDTPIEPENPSIANDIVLNASDSIYGGAVTCDSVMTVKTDGTWSMDVTVYGNTIPGAVSGTWIMNDDSSLTLTTTNMVDGAVVPETITLAFNEDDGTYSTTVPLNCMGQFDFTLNFA